jgi:hydroxyacylglutathione hydrolase
MKVRHFGLAALLGVAVLPGTARAADAPGSWFTTSKVADNVWRIDDHGADNMYLVAGTKKALLIDTGLGVGDIMKIVRTLTPLPVVVVDTHGHPDHAGGNPQFAEVYAHPDDFELARFFSSKEQRDGSRANMLKGVEIHTDQLYQEPENAPATKLIPVKDGDVFDLGGRQLTVIATPGHTPGSICLVDKEHKLLFTGDDNNTVEWMFLDHSTTLEKYLHTLEALDARKDFETVLPGHGDALDKAFIGEQVACVRSILDGSCKDEPYKSFAGEARLCKYERASVAFKPEKLR